MNRYERIFLFLGLFAGIICLRGQSEVESGVPLTIANPAEVHIFWDASFSMRSRNLKREAQFLKHYLDKEGANATVHFYTFTDRIDQTTRLGSGADAALAIGDQLEDVFYNGMADLSILSQINYKPESVVLLFTDGNMLNREIALDALPPVLAVSSVPGANVRDLEELARQTSGYYLDLYRRKPNGGLENMLGEQDFETRNSKLLVYGVVHSNFKPIRGAVVREKNSFNEVTTGANGMYRISVPKGTILEVRAFGMETLDTLVGDGPKIHIPMKVEGELLNEVTVTGKRSDAETVETGFGDKKKGAVGYSLANQVTSKDIRADQIELWQIMQKMPGVVVIDPYSPNPRYKFRRTQTSSITGSTFPAIVVNGLVYDQSQQEPPFINTQMIERITLLKSMMATNRYGQLAAAGAIVIELKEGADYQEEASNRISPVKGNDFNEQLLSYESNERLPDSFRALKEADDLDTAREQFEKLLSRESELSVGFFLDAASALKARHPGLAHEVLMNIAEIAPTNEKALRTLVFALEEQGRNKEASPVYERLVNLVPGKAQSYLDLARNYKEVGRYQLAATLYRQMIANSIPNVDFNDVGETVFNELKQLVSLYKSRIDFNELPMEFLKVGFKQDIRIVVEWNDPMADFELQFVSPGKKYFQMSHNLFGDREAIEKEIAAGYSIMEFAIDDAEAGQWMVNLNYRGDQDPLNPVVLKYTIYTNYGLPSEEREIKTVTLQDLNSKVVLDSFVY